jgi:hypothetical protein
MTSFRQQVGKASPRRSHVRDQALLALGKDSHMRSFVPEPDLTSLSVRDASVPQSL